MQDKNDPNCFCGDLSRCRPSAETTVLGSTAERRGVAKLMSIIEYVVTMEAERSSTHSWVTTWTPLFVEKRSATTEFNVVNVEETITAPAVVSLRHLLENCLANVCRARQL